jgi:hypothetical protein
VKRHNGFRVLQEKQKATTKQSAKKAILDACSLANVFFLFTSTQTMNVTTSSPRRSFVTLSQMGNASHQKMESIGEISTETSSTMSGGQPQPHHHKSAKNQSYLKEKQQPVLHKSSIEPAATAVATTTTTCSVSLILVSGERVDVSNLVPESERTPERLNRRRITQQLFRGTSNETVYPKLPDPMQDDSIDLHVLLAQHQRKQQQNTPVVVPSRQTRTITTTEPEPLSHQSPPPQRSTGYSTPPPPPGTNNDRRANWQQEQTFAQHSFTRRQQERSHQQQHQHQHQHQHQQPAVRGLRYPYAHSVDPVRHQEFPGGENSPDDGTLLSDMRSHRRREAYGNGEYSSSPPRGRTMTRPSQPEQGSSYLIEQQRHINNNNYSHEDHRGDHHLYATTTSANASEYEYEYAYYQHQHQHQAQYPEETENNRPQHYPYGSGRGYPSPALPPPQSGSNSFHGSEPQLLFSGNGSSRRRDQQRAREGRDRQYPPTDTNGYSGGGGVSGSYERGGHNSNGGGGGDGHASMYEMRSSRRNFDRGDYQHQPPAQQQQQQHRPQPQPPKKNRLEVEIAPGVMARLRGADETTLALEQGRVVGSDCLCCGARSLCIDDACYLLCPICKVVNPLHNTTADQSGGVGLGILESEADYY